MSSKDVPPTGLKVVNVCVLPLPESACDGLLEKSLEMTDPSDNCISIYATGSRSWKFGYLELALVEVSAWILDSVGYPPLSDTKIASGASDERERGNVLQSW